MMELGKNKVPAEAPPKPEPVENGTYRPRERVVPTNPPPPPPPPPAPDDRPPGGHLTVKHFDVLACGVHDVLRGTNEALDLIQRLQGQIEEQGKRIDHLASIIEEERAVRRDMAIRGLYKGGDR